MERGKIGEFREFPQGGCPVFILDLPPLPEDNPETLH